MKVGVLIETVYQAVQAMKPSVDSSVKRIDIRAYLPAAINFALQQQYYIDIKTEKDSGAMPKLFVGTYENVVVKYHIARALKYVDLPAKPVALSNEMGIEMVSTMQGDTTFYPLKSQHQLQGYERFTGGNTGYWLESDKMFFKGISPFVNEVLIRMIATVEDLNNEDTVPVPAGMEAQVIDMCVKHFTGAKFAGQDNLQDNVDIKVNTQQQ